MGFFRRNLETMERRRKVAALVHCLADDDLGVRRDALAALKRLGDAGAVRPLLEFVRGDHWNVTDAMRRSALDALACTRDPRALNALLAALSDPCRHAGRGVLCGTCRDVRKAAAFALGEIRDARAVGALSSAIDEECLMTRGVAEAAAKALGKIGGAAAVDALCAAVIRASSGSVREAAAAALGEAGGAPAVDALCAVVSSEHDHRVRSTAATALGNTRDVRAVDALHHAASEGVASAVEALAMIRDERAVDALCTIVKEGAPHMRAGAASMLGRIGDATAVAELCRAVHDQDWEVSEAAAAALEKLGMPGDADVAMAVRAWAAVEQGLRNHDLRGAVPFGSAAVAPLRKVLDTSKGSLRIDAAVTIGEIGGARALDALVGALGSTNAEVRGLAARGLARMREPGSVEPLCKALLSDTIADVRKAAAEALGKIADPMAITSLESALEDVEETCRCCAATALGEIRDARAVPPLCKALLENRSESVRDAAAQALEKIAHASAVDALVEALIVAVQRRNYSNCCSAASALGSIGDARAVTALITSLEQPPRISGTWGQGPMKEVPQPRRYDEDTVYRGPTTARARASAALALARIGDLRAVPALLRAVSDPDVSEGALEAFSMILERQPSNVDACHLKAFAALPDAVPAIEYVSRYHGSTDDWSLYPVEKQVSATRLKGLAARELARRPDKCGQP